jgi:hypothetical protein
MWRAVPSHLLEVKAWRSRIHIATIQTTGALAVQMHVARASLSTERPSLARTVVLEK